MQIQRYININTLHCRAQLKVLKTIVDPACAALAYNLGDPALKHKIVIVVDFGAGLDISLLSINTGVVSLKYSEDLKLGGDDIVNNLVRTKIHYHDNLILTMRIRLITALMNLKRKLNKKMLRSTLAP